MTPHLAHFKNGDEFNAMTKRGRRVHKFRPSTRAGSSSSADGNGLVRGLMVPLAALLG